MLAERHINKYIKSLKHLYDIHLTVPKNILDNLVVTGYNCSTIKNKLSFIDGSLYSEGNPVPGRGDKGWG